MGTSICQVFCEIVLAPVIEVQSPFCSNPQVLPGIQIDFIYLIVGEASNPFVGTVMNKGVLLGIVMEQTLRGPKPHGFVVVFRDRRKGDVRKLGEMLKGVGMAVVYGYAHGGTNP